MARQPDGVKHVDRLPGPAESKRRLREILKTLMGETSVAEACEALGISEARFHALRRQALEGALSGLSPRPSGRPGRHDAPEPEEVEELRRENEELKMELYATEIREEIALTMPHLLEERSLREKKIARRKRRQRRKAGKSSS